jgi:hypothetical protein
VAPAVEDLNGHERERDIDAYCKALAHSSKMLRRPNLPKLMAWRVLSANMYRAPVSCSAAAAAASAIAVAFMVELSDIAAGREGGCTKGRRWVGSGRRRAGERLSQLGARPL